MTDETERKSDNRISGTMTWLLIVLSAYGTVWTAILVVIPQFQAKFNAYGLQLPPLTKWILDLTGLLGDWWFVAMTLGLLVLVAGVVIGRHGFASTKPGTRFAACCLFAMILALAVTLIAMGVTWVKLYEGLRK